MAFINVLFQIILLITNLAVFFMCIYIIGRIDKW